MFRRRREKKAIKEAVKAAKAQEEAAKSIQLLRVAPRGTRYGTEGSPDFPQPLRPNLMISRSMDALNEAPTRALVVHQGMEPATGRNKKQKKKKGLRRVHSLAEDGMLAQSPQERYRPLDSIPDGAVYYVNEPTRPVYLIEDPNGDVHQSHPNARPRYLVSAVPAQSRSHDRMGGYLASPGTPPVLYQYNQSQFRDSPTTPPELYASDATLTRTAGGGGRNRNYVQIIPRPENSKPSSGGHRRPVSQFYQSSPMRPISTPLRTPSPNRSPSPVIYNTGPRKGRGKEIKVIEGWDDGPDDKAPQVIQSHEVGVAPKSKVVTDRNAAKASAPFSITISDSNPASSNIKLREPSRRNKARPVSAAPWISSNGTYQNGGERQITQENGQMVVDFNE